MKTHITWTRQLFVRDLGAVIDEIRLFPDDATVWATAPGITNSAGNLALHLCGNLQHFVGTALGHTDYVRTRDLEFSSRDVSRDSLVAELGTTIDVVTRVLSSLDDSALLLEYPDILGGLRLPTGLFLQHLCVHLGFHVGQIGYLRRVLTGQATSSGAIDMHRLTAAGS